jgi:type I restriction enzyme S subunit
MKSEWREYLLGDLYNFSSGLSKNSKEFGFGKPFLSFKTVFNNYILPEELPDLVNSNVDEQERCSIMKGDIFLTRTSETLNELGMSSVALRDYPEATFNGFTKRLRPKGKQIYPLYVAYYMRSPFFRANINSMASMTTRASLNNDILSRLPIQVPTYGEQEKIGDILYSFDKKIKLNHRINENLFQQAQALYKGRFIDMMPFDGSMPEDWHCGTVSEIIELHDSKRIPLSSRERANLAKIYPYYGATSVMDYVDRYLFDGIYLLLGEDGTVVDSKGFPILQYVEGKFWVNNHAHIITGKNGFSVELLYLLFSLTSVQSIVTGAVQPKISQANLNKVPVIIPSGGELKAFDATIQSLFAQIRNLRAENNRLVATRDTLLPKLMSGELDVSDIDL